MELSVFITYAVALGVAAAIPGPGVIALVARALGSGFRPTLPMVLGLVAGDVTYLAVAVLGLAWIAKSFGAIFIVIKFSGALYLAWMAWTFWSSGITSEKVQAKKAAGPWVTFLAGLFVTLGNPKTIIFYLALLPGLMDLTAVDAVSFFILVFITFAVLVVVMVPYIAMAGRARLFLQTPRALKTLNRFAATCLAGAAAAIALRTA